LGFTRLALEQADLTTTTRGHIAKASHAGAALLTTVNDILDFSKLESGQLQIHREPCDADEVSRAALGLFSAAAEAKGVALRYAAQDLPPYLSLDPDRLRQLLLNLIGNAVKFSDEGEVRVFVSWRNGRLAVAVEDDGPGIAPEQQSLLFRRFSQVDGSATRRHGGTGLGLAICRGLVDAMAGDIGVESQVGQGARFFFELPAEPCDAADAEAATTAAFPPGVRVLVADDHAINRELVRAILTPLGAEVVEAADGTEAAALAVASPFDVILMDLRMPQLDGLGAMTAIRSGEGPNRTAPILAFSAGADAPGAEDRRRAGFDGDLAKPLMPADLIEAVAEHAGPPAAPQRPRRALSSRR
ncbi:MAG: ATP-binding protein, partial [Phenylobacterium sp.]